MRRIGRWGEGGKLSLIVEEGRMKMEGESMFQIFSFPQFLKRRKVNLLFRTVNTWSLLKEFVVLVLVT